MNTQRVSDRGKNRKKKKTVSDPFYHQKKQNVPVNGSTEIPGHDELHCPRVQLRYVSKSVRIRGHERSFPVREQGLSG